MKYFSRINWRYAREHKKTSIAVLVLVVLLGYYGYDKITDTSSETKYAIAAVKRGTVISIVSGTGQVSASKQVSIKSKVSGDVTYVGVGAGQWVSAGAIIAQLDSRDARIALENAQISLEKLKKPADASTITQAENSLADAKEAKQKATDNLPKNYDDGYTTVANTLADLPDVLTGLNNLFHSYQANAGFLNDHNLSGYSEATHNLRDKAEKSYYKAEASYQATLSAYKNISRRSDSSRIDSVIVQTYETTKEISQAVKEAQTATNYVKDQLATNDNNANNAISSLNTWSVTVNNHLSGLLDVKNAIETAKATLASADRNIAEKTQSLQEIKDGTDPLDLQSQELTVQQKEYALADYTIRAPFDGQVAALDVSVGDSISGSTELGTFITKQKIAEISLNEVDVAKIKLGNKATLTFDAIDGLNITGEILEIDQVGTVSQGVVSYNVKIGFDTDDDRVKTGMSVSADITTDVRQNVLVVANSAIKTNGSTYVLKVDNSVSETQGSGGVVLSKMPNEQEVTVGLSDDTNTEILSGLVDGDKVVSRILLPSTNASSAQAPSLLGGGSNRSSSNRTSARMPGL